MEAGARPITTLLVDISGDAVDEDAPYGPLDTLLKFDMNLVTRMLYPAIDPIASTSTLLPRVSLLGDFIPAEDVPIPEEQDEEEDGNVENKGHHPAPE